MAQRIQFLNFEEDDKDIVISFAIDDSNMLVKSLILHRTFFFEEFLDDEERGVNVSLEDDTFEQENYNTLESIKIRNDELEIVAAFRKYKLDISKIDKSDIDEMLRLLNKQNYDNRFAVDIAQYSPTE